MEQFEQLKPLLEKPLDGTCPSVPQVLRIGTLVIWPPLLQAPMAGYTTWAYRQLLRRLGGVGLTCTEMVHARGFFECIKRGRVPERLLLVDKEPRPLAVQIWDHDPDAMAAMAAELVRRYGVSLVDINFGCPVRRVTLKAHSGAYLLREPERIEKIVRQVVHAVEVPVTTKIRLGWSQESINAVEVVHAVREAGARAVTIHGRTASQMFSGKADWEKIAQVKSHFPDFPVIGNGDITTPQQAVEAFQQYGVDGVMIGRAGLGKPWIFRQAAALLAGKAMPPDPTLEEQKQLLLEHYGYVCQQFGPEYGTILMRRYACCYVQGYRGAKQFRTHISKAGTPEEFYRVVEEFFPRQ